MEGETIPYYAAGGSHIKRPIQSSWLCGQTMCTTKMWLRLGVETKRKHQMMRRRYGISYPLSKKDVSRYVYRETKTRAHTHTHKVYAQKTVQLLKLPGMQRGRSPRQNKQKYRRITNKRSRCSAAETIQPDQYVHVCLCVCARLSLTCLCA